MLVKFGSLKVVVLEKCGSLTFSRVEIYRYKSIILMIVTKNKYTLFSASYANYSHIKELNVNHINKSRKQC